MVNLKELRLSHNKLTGKRSAPVLSASFGSALTWVFGCSGEIPVVLLRWKFVENRTVELKNNAGLTLPPNIGELGDSVTKIDLSNHSLWSELYFVCPSRHALYVC